MRYRIFVRFFIANCQTQTSESSVPFLDRELYNNIVHGICEQLLGVAGRGQADGLQRRRMHVLDDKHPVPFFLHRILPSSVRGLM